MNKIKLLKTSLIFTLFFGFFTQPVRAQDSMMPEVSYLLLEKLIATAKENYPRVKAYTLRTVIAKTNISKTQLGLLDPLSVSYIKQPKNSINIVTPNIFTGYQIGASINLGSYFTKPANIKDARNEYKIAKLDEEEYNLSLENEVKTRYFSYVQSLITLRSESKNYIDTYSITKDAKSKYDRGEITFLEYNEAQKTQTGVLQAKIQAEGSLLAAKASLEELLMKRIEEVK